MIYDLTNTADVGKRFYRLFDANGFEYWHTVYVNTETGEVVNQVIDSDGLLLVDPDTCEVMTEKVQAAPPLFIEWAKEGQGFHPNYPPINGWKYKGCICTVNRTRNDIVARRCDVCNKGYDTEERLHSEARQREIEERKKSVNNGG